MKKEEVKISEELVLNEIEKFVDCWVEKPETRNELKDAYPNIFNSISKGLLVLNEDCVPVYTLANPVKNEDGEITKSYVDFKTRITPTNQARIAKGLNIQLDQLQFGLNCISYIIGEPLAMLDKFSKKDFNTIREISSVFM